MVFCSGIDAITIDELQAFSRKELSKERVEQYQRDTFSGWKKAQEVVFALQEEHWLAGDPKKDARRHYLYRTYQRLLDCIIWHHFGPDMADAKRIFEHEPKIQNLAFHNIQDHYDAASKINSDPNKFALITDLTSGIRLGDLFICEVGKPSSFIEVKSGSTNRQILKAIESRNIAEMQALAQSEKTKKQVDRILKQAAHAHQLVSILKTGKGTDKDLSAKPLEVFEASKPLTDFSDELDDMFQKLVDEIDLSTVVVEECLLLVATRVKNQNIFSIGPRIAKEIDVFDGASRPRGIKLDFVMALTASSVMRPLYIQPIKSEFINHLLARDLQLTIYLSLDKFQKKFATEICQVSWLEGRAFRKQWAASGHHYAIRSRDRALKFSVDGSEEMLLSNGLFQRVISQMCRPSYLHYMHHQMLIEMGKQTV